ncbi:MAG: hypothetical protein J6X55_10465 [Victivallales bacterium]|nr:hypothetical protein [Victivallales bacterium]
MMAKVFQFDLNGEWQMTGRMESGLSPRVFTDGDVNISIMVPGNIEEALAVAGIVPDPYIQKNAMALRPYEFYEWCLVRRFDYDDVPRNFELVFEGLDCMATIWLNGKCIGHSDNALITHRFSTLDAMKRGENVLAVHLASANNALRSYPMLANTFCCNTFNYETLRIRKPAHVWGWDITPRMALGGIFRPVTLREVPEWRIDEDVVQLQGFESDGSAWLQYMYKISIPEFSFKDLRMEIDGVCGDSHWHEEQDVWSAMGLITFLVKEPKLWWPRHYGEQNLYVVTARLVRPSTGEIMAEHVFRIGIRDLKLKFNPTWTTSPEPDVQFIVNGTPIRCFGFNHVPADSLHSHDVERLQKELDLACELDCNMIRIWGGGIYESDAFYDRCDEEGILLWHDFMMACAVYPGDADFQNALRIEAESVIRRLRQHPCIAVWVGDNECDCCYSWGVKQDPEANLLTRGILKEACRLHDPTRPYLPSSPCHTPEAAAQARTEGVANDMEFSPEMHLWGPRDYFKSDFYRNAKASFVSEIGYHGCPNVSSIRRFISPERQWPWTDNDEWDYHASNPFMSANSFLNYRTRLMANQIREMFGEIPVTLEEFAFASQICQAEAKKYFVELARSRKKMTGLLWWNLIDCWPQFSDAVIDYYYGKKLAFHYLARLHHSVLLVMPEAVNWHQSVVAANDSRETVRGTYRVWDAENGDSFAEGDFELAPGAVVELVSVHVCTTAQKLYLISWRLSDGTVGVNHALTGHPPFDLGRYRSLLKAIAELDGSFRPDEVAR